AEAHIAALEKLTASNGAYVYNIGTGLGHSVMEVIDEAMEITGRMIPIKVVARRTGDPARLVADVSRAHKELGWQPRCDLRSILESSWQWHKNLVR
ncbi:MAG: GDP-mannose 4,6-dehydratase, partial [Patescibacteria group bacterium]